jgi:hypothetical protein
LLIRKPLTLKELPFQNHGHCNIEMPGLTGFESGFAPDSADLQPEMLMSAIIIFGKCTSSFNHQCTKITFRQQE